MRSISIAWWIPTGTMHDAPELIGEDSGSAAILCAALLERGAGGLDSRSFNEELDRIGVMRDISVRASMTRVHATFRTEHMGRSIELLRDLVCSPELPEDALEPVRSLCLQAIEGLLDDPSARALVHLRRRAIPHPYNRSSYGSADGIRQVTIEDIHQAWSTRFRPAGSIIAIAGAVEPEEVATRFEHLFEGWEGAPPPVPELGEVIGGDEHLDQETAQVHMEMAVEAPLVDTSDELPFFAAVRALGGGTSSRLFTVVRERQSLCYDVHAGYLGTPQYGKCLIGAGTTPERVAQTYQSIREEFERFGSEGLHEDEFRRVIRGMKTHLMMHGESTAARAAAIAMDKHQRANVRTLADMSRLIDGLTYEEVDSVARRYMTTENISGASCVAVGPTAPFKA